MAFTPVYYNPPTSGGYLLSPWLSDCLSHTGQNSMVVPFEAIPGTDNVPGISWQGDECTGFNNPAIGVTGVVSFKQRVLEFCSTGINFISGLFKGSLQATTLTANRTWTLPDSSGTFALTSDIPVSSWSEMEIPSGTINGSNEVFTTAHSVYTVAGTGNTAKSITVYLNGIAQRPEIDYTLSGGNTITMSQAPTTDFNIYVSYYIAS